MILRNRVMLFAGAALATGQIVLAQAPADRHPAYDVAASDIPGIYPEATELKITASPDNRIFLGSARPFHEEITPEAVELKAWRGERSNCQLVVSTGYAQANLRVTSSPLRMGNHEIATSASMIRYTRAGQRITADIIDFEKECLHAAGAHRAIWFEANVPQKAEPGVYRGTVTVSAPGCEPAVQEITLEVQPATLPAPQAWKMHLDLWQHPQSVARWHDVEPWSPVHFELLRPLMQRLAAAGQKCITCTLLDEAWNAQTYDWFPSMIQWKKGRDGVMRYDYSILDKWIHFMHDEIGIREQISCYSMLPWHLSIKYYDEVSGEMAIAKAEPGTPGFEALWAPFLRDFHKHMQEKGWAEKTCIAIDERPDRMVREAMRLVKENAPSFRIASAVDKPSELTREVYNISPVITHAGTALGDLLRERKAAGKITTFYVCMQPLVPNTYTTSTPAEAEWLGIFAAANRLDGFLRWAYNSWNRNPLQTTDFGNWTSGDCFLVYPGNRSSIRFERLRDGIEEYEKIQLLRERAKESSAAAAIVDSMNTRLAAIFTVERSSQYYIHTQDVKDARAIVDETLTALNALQEAQNGSLP
ncbi:MAG: DUF4091 domain-containing protein [Akkermansia sp.]|nr:DUF4091 domain-containing protein [Akkermansia sp.]